MKNSKIWQILQCLTIQGANSAVDSNSTAGVSRAMVKDRFKTFNTLFEEIHQRQSQWTVPDSELRESLRLAVAEVLLPAYRSFIRRFGYVFILPLKLSLKILSERERVMKCFCLGL